MSTIPPLRGLDAQADRIASLPLRMSNQHTPDGSTCLGLDGPLDHSYEIDLPKLVFVGCAQHHGGLVCLPRSLDLRSIYSIVIRPQTAVIQKTLPLHRKSGCCLRQGGVLVFLQYWPRVALCRGNVSGRSLFPGRGSIFRRSSWLIALTLFCHCPERWFRCSLRLLDNCVGCCALLCGSPEQKWLRTLRASGALHVSCGVDFTCCPRISDET